MKQLLEIAKRWEEIAISAHNSAQRVQEYASAADAEMAKAASSAADVESACYCNKALKAVSAARKVVKSAIAIHALNAASAGKSERGVRRKWSSRAKAEWKALTEDFWEDLADVAKVALEKNPVLVVDLMRWHPCTALEMAMLAIEADEVEKKGRASSIVTLARTLAGREAKTVGIKTLARLRDKLSDLAVRDISWRETLRRMGACPNALTWLKEFRTIEEAWYACDRAEWLLWVHSRSVYPDPAAYAALASQWAEQTGRALEQLTESQKDSWTMRCAKRVQEADVCADGRDPVRVASDAAWVAYYATNVLALLTDYDKVMSRQADEVRDLVGWPVLFRGKEEVA